VSRENVEVIERVPAAGNSGDFETILALHHPDWEGVIAQEYPVAGTWRGLEGVRFEVSLDPQEALKAVGLEA
jgi:hypothetical protein